MHCSVNTEHCQCFLMNTGHSLPAMSVKCAYKGACIVALSFIACYYVPVAFNLILLPISMIPFAQILGLATQYGNDLSMYTWQLKEGDVALMAGGMCPKPLHLIVWVCILLELKIRKQPFSPRACMKNCFK